MKIAMPSSTRRDWMGRACGLGGALMLGATLPRPAQANADRFFQPFLGDLPDELRRAQAEGRKGLLLIYEREGCPFCELLHRVALADAQVQAYYARHFNAIRIDVRGSVMITGFDGAEVSEREFAQRQKVRGTPTSVFHDLSGREVARHAGAPESRDEYLQLGEYVAQGRYRGQSFEDWRKARATGR